MKKTRICYLDRIKSKADNIILSADFLQKEIDKFITYQNRIYVSTIEKFNFSDEEKKALESLLFSKYEEFELLPF